MQRYAALRQHASPPPTLSYEVSHEGLESMPKPLRRRPARWLRNVLLAAALALGFITLWAQGCLVWQTDSLSAAARERLVLLFSQQCPRFETRARIEYYLGPWARCAQSNGSCPCEAAPNVVECHHGADPPMGPTFCFGPHHWLPRGRPTGSDKVFRWFATDMAEAFAQDAGSADVDVVACKFGDQPPAEEETRFPAVAKVRTLGSTSHAVLMKLNTPCHFEGLLNVMEEDDLLFGEKKDAAVWRGGPSGFSDHGQRHELLQRVPGWSDVPQLDVAITKRAGGEAKPLRRLSRWIEKSVLARVVGEGTLGRGWLDRRAQMRYKMIVMVEGTDVASGLKWALLSSSAVLMPPPTVSSWAMEELLQPWVHYVPLHQNCSDLPERAHWCIDNAARCEAIGQAGRCFARQFLDQAHEQLLVGEVMRQVKTIMRREQSCAAACGGGCSGAGTLALSAARGDGSIVMPGVVVKV